jgi:hypothetical protein
VPEWKGKEGAVKAAFNYYATLVYPGQKRLGEVDVQRLANLQDFYLERHHPAQVAGRGTLHQPIHQVRAY